MQEGFQNVILIPDIWNDKFDPLKTLDEDRDRHA